MVSIIPLPRKDTFFNPVPLFITIDIAGNVYVAEKRTRNVYRYSPAGELVSYFELPAIPTGGIEVTPKGLFRTIMNGKLVSYDLRQDILEKFLENNHERLQRFSFRCRLSSWIGSVVNNHLYDNYTSSIRRERREEGFETFKRNIFEQEKQSERLIEKIDSREKVEKALEQLTPAERRTIRMLYWDGLKPVDIARITGEKNTTITSRISRARGKLREVFLENDKGKGEKAI